MSHCDQFVFSFSISDEGIDKETFLSLGDSGSINVLIPKIGPRVKFRKRLKEFLQVMCSNARIPYTNTNMLVFQGLQDIKLKSRS